MKFPGKHPSVSSDPWSSSYQIMVYHYFALIFWMAKDVTLNLNTLIVIAMVKLLSEYRAPKHNEQWLPSSNAMIHA